MFAVPASAASVVWTLAPVELGDGGTASGSFAFDADTGVYSAIDLHTTSGSIFGGADYAFVYPLSSADALVATTFSATDLAGTQLVELIFTVPLTNAGGTIDLSLVIEGLCTDSSCNGTDNVRGMIGVGTVTTSAATTPEPATSALVLGGAVAVAGIRRRTKRRTCSGV
ncbi:MAG: PEP-CTERM sorting domain-containing protein [Acidobacteriota bacterium]